MSRKKILVTGSKGTLGVPLVVELKRRGHEVWQCDLQHQRDENYIRADVSKYRQLERVFEQEYDYVYHLAAYAAEGLSHFIKRFNYNNNLVGSVNLLNAAINFEIKCFVFTSSIAVYGDSQLPMREDMIPCPEDPYGVAKNEYNSLTFQPVTTDALRIAVQLQEGFSGGILEWRVP